MSKEEFKTYWIVDDIKVNGFGTMRKRVLAGATAIEVTAASQRVAADERRRRAREDSIMDAEIRKAAAQRAYERSVEGKRQAAIRFGAQNPGGVISDAINPFAELDSFSPKHTNELKP